MTIKMLNKKIVLKKPNIRKGAIGGHHFRLQVPKPQDSNFAKEKELPTTNLTLIPIKLSDALLATRQSSYIQITNIIKRKRKFRNRHGH